MKTTLFSILVGMISLTSASDDFDEPIYMLYYTGLDTIPVAYGSCMPLTVYGYPASIVLMGAPSHCTAYSDEACQSPLTPRLSVDIGLTGLEELGDAFSMENFMVCTLDGDSGNANDNNNNQKFTPP